MRFACVLLVVTGCGFPDVHYSDAGLSDATVQEAGDGGSDGGTSSDSGRKCTMSGECGITCTGKLTMGNCGCQAFYVADGKPACDTSCDPAGCLGKTNLCTDAGECIVSP